MTEPPAPPLDGESAPPKESAAPAASVPAAPGKRGPWPVRLGIGLLVVGVVAIGGFSVSRRQPADATIPEGTVIDGALTLITSDRGDVACASEGAAGARRCGFNDDGSPRKGDERNTLQPFMTANRHLYLIPGLFLDAAIKRRYDSEPPHPPREQLKRFTAHCKLTVIGKMKEFKLRWIAADPWSPPQQPAEIATATDCKVDG